MQTHARSLLESAPHNREPGARSVVRAFATGVVLTLPPLPEVTRCEENHQDSQCYQKDCGGQGHAKILKVETRSDSTFAQYRENPKPIFVRYPNDIAFAPEPTFWASGEWLER
jgi:hypothetical protein